MQSAGTLGFLICPTASTANDYDFALWDVTGLPSPCSIFQGTANLPAPVRCNFSTPQGVTTCCGLPANHCTTGGLTGLDHTNPWPGNLSYGAGGPPVMPGLTVSAGQTFLLVVDNWSGQNTGFTITFYGTAQYFDATPPAIDSVHRVCSTDYASQLPALTRLRVRFSEFINPSTVAADGSDFTLIDNTTSTPVPITSAAPVNPPQTRWVELAVSQPVVPGRSYTLYIGYNPVGSGSPNGLPGTDGNTISDQCGNFSPIAGIPPGSGSSSYTFSVLDTLQVQFNTVSPACVGTATGQVNAQVSGGLPPYEYVLVSGSGTIPPTSGWSNTNLWTGRAAGTYTLWVRDQMGCIQRRGIQLVDPPPLSIVVQDSLTRACGGLPTGFVQFDGVGGTPPYTYSILPISPTWQPTGYFGTLNSGNYTLRVRDANGCIATRSFTVQIAAAVDLQLVSIDTVRCAGETGGFAVQAVGGDGGGFVYTLQNTGQTNVSGLFTGLGAGSYIVEAQDASGCVDTLRVTLSQPDSLRIREVLITPSLCLTSSQGAISLTVEGGNPPYTFSWRDSLGNSLGGSTSRIEDLPPGSYSVTVTDRKGCTVSSSPYSVGYLHHAEVRSVSYEIIEDCPSKRVRYTVDAGGVPPLSFHWTWEDGSQELTSSPTIERSYNPLQGGTLPVKVEVSSGGACSVDTAFTVPFTACAGLIIPTVFTPNGDGINDRWRIQALGFSAYRLVIYDRWGMEIWTNGNNNLDGWDGNDKQGRPVPEGAYVYFFSGTDNNGVQVQRTGTVSVLR
ncbi:MAG: gliding motility-associated C-terminal domain-containing protein [Bacteroidia bacterium]|nr:gliding motility-associated C-terminal domain-containing protein [Bacteroidia bacterium]